jgi:hypothetical protein
MMAMVMVMAKKRRSSALTWKKRKSNENGLKAKVK